MWRWLQKSHICVARIVFSVQHDDSIKDITSFIPPTTPTITKKSRTVSFKPSHRHTISSVLLYMLDLSCRCCRYHPAVGFPRKHWGCTEWRFSDQFLLKILHFVRHFPCLFMHSQGGRLISLEDAAAFGLVYLSLCFQPHIKMPGSAGYHGGFIIVKCSFQSCWFLLLDFHLGLSACLLPSTFLSLSLCPPILISFQRTDKTLLNNVTHGPPILYQFFFAAITKRRPSRPRIQHLDMIVSLNYKVYQHPQMVGHSGGGWGL